MSVTPLDPALWRDLIGLPFRHRGRGPDAYDCYGLVCEISKRQGIIIYDAAYPTDDAEQDALIRGNLHRWARCEPGPGAVLLFRQGALKNHVGVQLDQERFIHATAVFGQVKLDHLSRGAPPPQNLLAGAFRYVADH